MREGKEISNVELIQPFTLNVEAIAGLVSHNLIILVRICTKTLHFTTDCNLRGPLPH